MIYTDEKIVTRHFLEKIYRANVFNIIIIIQHV